MRVPHFQQTVLWLVLAPALVALGWLFGSRQFGQPNWLSPASKNPADRIEAPADHLAVSPVTYRSVKQTVEAAGTLQGSEEISICSTAEGRVVELAHDVADRLRPGDVLLRVDRTDYELAARQAEKALLVELAKLGLQSPPGPNFDVTAVPTVVEAKAKADNCQSHYRRARALSVHKAMTEEELDDREVDSRVAEAEYENQVSLAKAELATIQVKQEALAIAQQRLADTVVKVPPASAAVDATANSTGGSTGGPIYTVSKRAVTEGSYVHAGAEVYRLVIDRTLKMQVPVPDFHSSEVRDGQTVEVSIPGYARPLAGKVTRVNPWVDPATRTFEVEVQVPNPDGQLKGGSSAVATILTHENRDVATVPSDAPLTANGVTKLLLADGEGIRAVAVTLGAKSRDWVEVLRPALPRGTRVVTSGQLALLSGGVRR